jgi:hypothetical protein
MQAELPQGPKITEPKTPYHPPLEVGVVVLGCYFTLLSATANRSVACCLPGQDLGQKRAEVINALPVQMECRGTSQLWTPCS